MNNKTQIVSVSAFILAVILALVSALYLTKLVEQRTRSALAAAFDEFRIDWVAVEPDGLRAHLTGTAPDESSRIRALRIAGGVIDSSRISEEITVPIRIATVAPVFRIEMLRDRQNVSVIGLVPSTADGGPIVERLQSSLPGAQISDMLQSSQHAVPVGWVNAVEFSVRAMAMFEIGRISVTSGRIEVEALVDSLEARNQLEQRLRENAPRTQAIVLDLTAPRPVAAPFLLRVDLEDGAVQLGACAADTEHAQTVIQSALQSAGMTLGFTCPLALGTPSPRWGEAAAEAIAALANLEAGSLTLSDGDVVLTVPHTVSAAAFDRAIGRLETRLPDAFALSARRQDPPIEQANGSDGRPEVTVTLTEEGQLTLAGRLPDARIRAAVQAFARARFGAQAVELAARIDSDLPRGWSIRVLTALDALAELHHGSVLVLEDRIDVSGISGNPDATTQVTQAIVQALGAETDFTLDVHYDEDLDPVTPVPTADECEVNIQTILAETKISFDPGSIEINDAAGAVLDDIADVLRLCGELPMEVAGHTDSQGREETNRGLSQARAEAVVNGLMARRVLVSSLRAQGYGADQPIADNGTEEGRDANRRIAITLIRPEPEHVPLDPALEAELVFEIQTPDDETILPLPRPASLEMPEDTDTSGTAAPTEEGDETDAEQDN